MNRAIISQRRHSSSRPSSWPAPPSTRSLATSRAGCSRQPGCITNLHKLIKVALGDAPSSPCATGQTRVHLAGGDITAVTPDTGLNGGGTNGEAVLGLADGFKLPQGCAADAVAKRSGPTDWVCGFAALGNQVCPTGAVVTGISATRTLICGRSIKSPDETGRSR